MMFYGNLYIDEDDLESGDGACLDIDINFAYTTGIIIKLC